MRLMKEGNPLGGFCLFDPDAFSFRFVPRHNFSLDFAGDVSRFQIFRRRTLFHTHIADPDGWPMIVLQRITPQHHDPLPRKMMPSHALVHADILWSAPSGLLLYWLFGNCRISSAFVITNGLRRPDEPAAADSSGKSLKVRRRVVQRNLVFSRTS